MSKRQTFTGSTEALDSEVARFFELVSPELTAGLHFRMIRESDGIQKLFMRLRLTYPIYADVAGAQSMPEYVLRSYLTASKFFLEVRTSGVRFDDAPDGTSAMIFNYDLMLTEGLAFG